MMDQDDDIVFLSIHEKWAEKILDGTKRYEYRRIPPNRDPPYIVLLYATNGSSEIVGEAKIDRVVEADIENLLERTLNETPHEPAEIEEYFEGNEVGHALHVATVTRYDEPIHLSEIQDLDPDFTPPQNFIYLTPSEHSDLLALIPTYSTSASQQQLVQFEDES